MNAKLKAIAEQAANDLRDFVKEGEKDILEAWAVAEKEAQANESKPKLKLGFSISLDLDKDEVDNALTFGVKHTLATTHKIPDPDQATLKLEKETRRN